jgi:cell filamentation protein
MAFDVFGDFETAGYLRNTRGFKDSDAVREAENGLFQNNVSNALHSLAGKSGALSFQDVLETHRVLFIDFYPWAGENREKHAPDINITKGGYDDLFAHPAFIEHAVGYALQAGQQPNAMRERPGAILADLAYAHPFLDGNGRAIMTIHNELCRRQRIHIEWELTKKEEYLAALTEQMRNPNKSKALDEYLAPFVREGALSVEESTEQLRQLLEQRSPALSAGLSADNAALVDKAVELREAFKTATTVEEKSSITAEMGKMAATVDGPGVTKIPFMVSLSYFVSGKCQAPDLVKCAKAHDKAVARDNDLFKGRDQSKDKGYGHGIGL